MPIDFSESSRAALRYGAALAQRFGATLTLLNVVDLHPNNPADARLADDLEIQASGRLVHLLQQEVGSQVMADTLVREGRAWKAITDSARLRKVDLIVLGARGHTPHARGFLGRTAELVVRHAPCPVLVVGK